MTVRDLFDHFHCMFQKIVYYDKTANVEDVVHIENRKQYDEELYDDFLEEYGDYIVKEWAYMYDDSIQLVIEKDEWSDAE